MSEHEQLSFSTGNETKDESVVCLGLSFKNDKDRREYFREELRKKLPELRKIEGFPIGEDKTILTISDPPYYTACPNPWINDFIDEWEQEKSKKYGRFFPEDYNRMPFATDVSEGKNNTVYNAHSYHTKVPHKAIMRYILHYTNPGDIVFDGYCGSGMTGLASKMCESISEIESLGYNVENNVIKSPNGDYISKVGYRRAILTDLSPAATFISYNYNKKSNKEVSSKYLYEMLDTLEKKYAWLYKTFLNKNDELVLKKEILNIQTMSEIVDFTEKYNHLLTDVNYYIWSENYICENCTESMTYWDANVNKDEQSVKKNLVCPKCGAVAEKKNLQRLFSSRIDLVDGELSNHPKLNLMKINFNLKKGRQNKSPGIFDEKVLEILVTDNSFGKLVPTKIPMGIKTIEPLRLGLNKVHHFYTDRVILLIINYLESAKESENYQDAQFLLGSVLPKMTKMNRYMPQHASKEKGFRALVGPMANALYFPPISVENNFFSQIKFQLKKIINAWNEYHGNLISTQSSTKLNIESNSIDYIFIDPPFGSNIMYSELSFSREAWLELRTNTQKEAIENKSQGKNLNDYTTLILESFKEAYRILKPDRWITVEFSNTQASVWNSIQYALQESGFIIASVDALNKQRGGFHAMVTTTAVKQDLVISAYKPSKENINKMLAEMNTNDSAWTFTKQHLEKLPIFSGSKNEASIIPERTPRIIFDRMVAYHVQNGLPVPISSPDFQLGIAQRFRVRDGMVFLESQVAEYDKKRTLVKEFYQMSLFVSDENSAIEWLRQQLIMKPQTRQDLHTQFMKEIQHISKYEKLPELDDLLAQNFLRYDNEPEVPSQIVSYFRRNYPDLRGLESTDRKVMQKAMNRWYVPDPNKQADLEKLREKSLLREFNLYVDEMTKSKKKLKEFRTEAIRAGFKKAWSEKDYQTIVDVGNRLPETVIQEDDKLLMYFDNAQIKLGL